MNFLSSVADSVSNTVSDAANSVSNAVSAGADAMFTKVAEEKVEEHTGSKLDVELSSDIPDNLKDWFRGTGLNSLCTGDSWAFLDGSYNERKRELWKERAIKKIVLTAKTVCDDDDEWICAYPEWEVGSTTLTIVFYPRAFRWGGDTTWVSPSYKRWWNLADEIVFGLQLYQLPGKCFYKSDWLDEFDDVDPNSCYGGTMKTRRWFQFRHWIIFWYANAQWGYNWAYTPRPPKLPDGSDFNLNAVLSLPSLPDLKLPNIKLPSLPDVELPSLPDMPSVDLPSISAPSISAPSLGMPSMPSFDPTALTMPPKKERPSNKWASHGYIELTDLKVKTDGATLILSNAKVTDFWKKDGRVDTEEKENARMVLKATDADQANSWKESLMASGVEEGDAGGCCTVA